MPTASTAFYLLIMLYVAGSVLVAYVAVRAYRHVRQGRDQSVALPRPVYETTQRKSPFSFVRTNARSFNVWKLPIPWTRSPAGSSFQSKAASTAFAKDLSIELLPTTALPPPPTSIPTSPPLVDLTTPALESSTASRFSTSLPSSPRRQALSLWPSSPHKGLRNIQHPAFPRPPSPHALLATTPPQRQKRSRSLGGVPVRRLSSGQSGLRNKVDVELQDFIPGHTTRTSEEHLLIDFSSSSDDQISGSKYDPATISPTASDIGVPPPSIKDSKVVEPRPMPLVDIIGGDVSPRLKSEPDDTGWMWFNSNAPSTIRSYDARVLSPRSQAAPFLGQPKFAFPLSSPFQKAEKLIDVPSSGDGYVELDSLDSSRTLVEVEDVLLGKEDPPSPIVTSMDVGTAIDPFSDDYAVGYIPSLSQTHGNGDLVQHDQSYPPLIEIDFDESRVQIDQDPPTYPPLVDTDDIHMDSSKEGLVFGDSHIVSGTDSVSPTLSPVPAIDLPGPSLSTGPSSLMEQTDWRWVETNDPWADHVSTVQDESLALDPTCGGVAGDSHLGPATQDYPGENGFLGTSPGGSLLATALAADDEVPHLSLDDPSSTELRLSHVVTRGPLDDEDEEDATPRPTPISIEVQLPVSEVGINNTDGIGVLEENQLIEHSTVEENFPDPDLLPLPEFNPLFGIIEVVRTTNDDSDNELIKFEPRPSSQMPTPPASPPSLSPTLPNQKKAGKSSPPSPMTGPKNLSIASDMTRSHSRSSTPQAIPIPLPADACNEKPGDLLADVSVSPPTHLTVEDLLSGQAENGAEEAIELNENEDCKETPLPGSLPELSPTSSLTSVGASNSKTTQTVAVLLTEKPVPVAPFYPSVRAIVSQPVEIALAMQLRPGLGAGADPAWMVRFLMAMFGWFAVLVSGQENY